LIAGFGAGDASAVADCAADGSSAGGVGGGADAGFVCLLFTVLRNWRDYNGGELGFFQVFDHPQGVAGLVVGTVLHLVHEPADDGDAVAARIHFAQARFDFGGPVAGEIEPPSVIVQFNDEAIILIADGETDLGIAIPPAPIRVRRVGVFDDVGAGFVDGDFDLGDFPFAEAHLAREVGDNGTDLREVTPLAGGLQEKLVS
jgi:hypothetical protein